MLLANETKDKLKCRHYYWARYEKKTLKLCKAKTFFNWCIVSRTPHLLGGFPPVPLIKIFMLDITRHRKYVSRPLSQVTDGRTSLYVDKFACYPFGLGNIKHCFCYQKQAKFNVSELLFPNCWPSVSQRLSNISGNILKTNGETWEKQIINTRNIWETVFLLKVL